MAKVLKLQLQHQSCQWIFRVDFLYDWLVWSLCSPRDSQESSPTWQFKSINSSALSRLYGPTFTSYMTTGKTIAFTVQTFVGKAMSQSTSCRRNLIDAFRLICRIYSKLRINWYPGCIKNTFMLQNIVIWYFYTFQYDHQHKSTYALSPYGDIIDSSPTFQFNIKQKQEYPIWQWFITYKQSIGTIKI